MPRRIGYRIRIANSQGGVVPCDFPVGDVDGVEIAMSPTTLADDTFVESINRLLTGHDRRRGCILSLAVTVPPPLPSTPSCSPPPAPWAAGHTLSLFAEALHFLRRADVGCLSIGIQPAPENGSQAENPVNFDLVSCWYEFLRGIRFDAEAAGVRVAIEYRPTTGASLVGLGDLVDEVACCAVGVCVDAAECQNTASLINSLTTLGRRVHCVRLDADSVSLLCGLDHPSSATAYDDFVHALSGVSRDAVIILPDTADATAIRRLRAIVGPKPQVEGQESQAESHNL